MPSDDELRTAFFDAYEPKSGVEDAWSILIAEDYLGDARLKRDPLRFLLTAAKKLRTQGLRMAGRPPPPGRSASSEPSYPAFPLEPKEWARARAVRTALVKRVGAEPGVRRFREAVLEEPLRPSEAHDFVHWPPTAKLRPEAFRDLGPLGDVAAGLEWTEERRDLRGWEARCSLYLDPPGESVVVTARAPIPVHEPLPELGWRGPEGQVELIAYWPDSVLHELRIVSYALTKSYPWDQAGAAWFVLTDDPKVYPIQVVTERLGGEHARGLITLEVEPWVPARRVRDLYHQYQAGMLLGRDASTPERVGTDVFTFVEERRDPTTQRPSLRDLAQQWNKANPDRAYEDLDKFGDIYRRTKAALLHPRYDVTADGKGRSWPALAGSPGVRWIPMGTDPSEAGAPVAAGTKRRKQREPKAGKG